MEGSCRRERFTYKMVSLLVCGLWCPINLPLSSLWWWQKGMSRSPAPPHPSSHSHVYLPVIHALEQRLLMPCLWYMRHHVPQRFIQWINPERKKKLPRMAHNFLLFFSTLADIVAVSIMASPVECYLTSAGLCIVLSGVCHLTCHAHKEFWIWLQVGGLVIQQKSNFASLKCMAKAISSICFNQRRRKNLSALPELTQLNSKY